jgi:ketosteroid isomerase-like protein
MAMLLASSPSIAQSAAEAAAVRSINDAFDAALSRRDIAAVEAAWVKDPLVTAIHPSSKGVVVGWEAVRKSWEGAFAAFPELSVQLKDPQIRINGNNAIVSGVEVIRGRRPNGDVVEFMALTTNVYERQGGQWLMVHHQASRAPQ